MRLIGLLSSPTHISASKRVSGQHGNNCSYAPAVYLVYVETADADRREWEETRGDNEVDPIRENFDILGQLTT